MDKGNLIGLVVIVIFVVAIIAVALYFICKKESFQIKGVTVDLSLDRLVKDVKKDLNAIGIKLKK